MLNLIRCLRAWDDWDFANQATDSKRLDLGGKATKDRRIEFSEFQQYFCRKFTGSSASLCKREWMALDADKTGMALFGDFCSWFIKRVISGRVNDPLGPVFVESGVEVAAEDHNIAGTIADVYVIEAAGAPNAAVKENAALNGDSAVGIATIEQPIEGADSIKYPKDALPVESATVHVETNNPNAHSFEGAIAGDSGRIHRSDIVEATQVAVAQVRIVRCFANLIVFQKQTSCRS